MKIKLNSDDELPLNKTIKILSMIIVVRGGFLNENSKYYPNIIRSELRKPSCMTK